MEITEAKIKLMPARSDRLQAFCTITLDNDFVIRDIKIIEGAKGAFVAMPSRKLTDKCPKCSGKNHLRSRFCNDCGGRLDENRASKDKRGRAKLHADIAHPINSTCRERLQARILEAFHAEVERSKQPGYVPPKLEDEEDFTPDIEEHAEDHHEPAHEVAPPAPVAKPEPIPEPARPAVDIAPVRAPEPPRPAVHTAPVRASEPARPPVDIAPVHAPEPAAATPEDEEEDEDLKRLEEEVRRYEERERLEVEQKKDKKDDFASGIF